ncbi:MAG: FAD-dependent oxidoreductase [Sphingomonadaceae bacterium]|nr:FAD-dependent oxidoreductase [Sphingomonadaceae bacterium]
MADFDETFDWVVVGSGAGSMSSALLMAKAGKSVVILEKADTFGGTTAKSGGIMWIPNNSFMDAGEDSTERSIEYLNAVVKDGPDFPGTSPERRSTYVVEATKMVDFVCAQGVALERGSSFWPDYYDELPGSVKTSRTVAARPFNKKELPGGWAKKLRQGFLELPITTDDGLKIPNMSRDWAARRIFAKTALKFVLGKVLGQHWVSAGAALQGRMLKAVLEKDAADIRLESPVNEVIIDGGKAVGVVTEKDGKPWRIGADVGILMNAGGFGSSQPMRDKYMPKTKVAWSNAIESNTGDMHRELERVGGVLAQMDQMVGLPGTRSPGWDEAYMKPGTQNVGAKPHAIQIDQSGERYMNEASSYEQICQDMIERDAIVPAVPSWIIMDSQYMKKFPLATKMGSRIPKAWRESGWLKEAGTIEGLAEVIKIKPEKLRATVDRWNGFVDKGLDEDFQRGNDRVYSGWLGDTLLPEGPSRTLGKIESGPFYAIDVIPGDVGTYGGVVTDCEARVLQADGTPFENLYACGVTTASPMGDVYPGAGASIGPSMTFGWIAAKHAAGLSNQDLT